MLRARCLDWGGGAACVPLSPALCARALIGLMRLFYVGMVSPSIAVCARALVGLMRLCYVGMVSPSIAAYPSETEIWWRPRS